MLAAGPGGADIFIAVTGFRSDAGHADQMMSESEAAGAAARIDALLPQTQCTRCGYPGCLPYAAAIAAGEAEINQCPPGGSATIEALAAPARSRAAAAQPGERRRVGAAHRLDRRGPLHRLRPLPAALPRRCHRRRRQVSAHGDRRALHGLRAVPRALPGRLHRDASSDQRRRRMSSSRTAGAIRRTREGFSSGRAPPARDRSQESDGPRARRGALVVSRP